MTLVLLWTGILRLSIVTRTFVSLLKLTFINFRLNLNKFVLSPSGFVKSHYSLVLKFIQVRGGRGRQREVGNKTR